MKESYLKKALLIDRSFNGEETRVAVVKDGILEEFDHEISFKRLKKGNVYLAQVTRVEAALQAAFLEFGDKKQGFLAFSEIHPGYYQHKGSSENKNGTEEVNNSNGTELQEGSENSDSLLKKPVQEEADGIKAPRPKPFTLRIQDVIKKGQIMLVQVVKDARGNKGAALTTYLSFAGRFVVFMPNSPGEVKVSRKITDKVERKHLTEMSENLEISEGMSVILRTAGLGRTEKELKRDYDRLIRVWKKIEELSKNAKEVPALLCEENDLIYRAFRDFYSNDIEEIWVDDKESFKKAQSIMKIFMPAHRKRVKLYQETECTLFEKYALEDMISNLYQPHVALPSGGYLIINQTEALVSIDVNSGKSIRERAMEETALKTNLEAAQAIGRQLRLRDLSGLIVIDFIDMPLHRYGQVEKFLEEALKADRARIQLGKISQFGLLEMSRQRLRQGLFESISKPCHLCHGNGYILSDNALAMRVLRNMARQASLASSSSQLTVEVSMEIGHVLINQYRRYITELENNMGISINLQMQSERKFDSVDMCITPKLNEVSLLASGSCEISDTEKVEEKSKEPLFLSADGENTEKVEKENKKVELPLQDSVDSEGSVAVLEPTLEKIRSVKKTKRFCRKKSVPQDLKIKEKVSIEESSSVNIPSEEGLEQFTPASQDDLTLTAVDQSDCSAEKSEVKQENANPGLMEMAKALEVKALKRRYRRRRIFLKEKVSEVNGGEYS
ncbi:MULTISPECIES: Rne/Rng family ribonuclease [Holospora]|uniref:Ribonuclease G n=2 Tax=Holospora TaxID=44747 RepID=A0A061JIK8_9PROT|nr:MULTISPECIES: ribonuclease E/G [Holospora]ETZ04914.1 ribonuclease E [Holospora undulata HU1]GAJ46521.1 ribonuclease E [Holospora elegans E1]